MKQPKSAYACGPLTELSVRMQRRAKRFYVRVADLCEKVTGVRAFVPHEHYDPVKNAGFEPWQVDKAERHQIRYHTTYLIVIAIAPTWGGGIEVEMANRYGVPVIILCDLEKLVHRKISRLLRGNPAVKAIITYSTQDKALEKLCIKLTEPVAA